MKKRGFLVFCMLFALLIAFSTYSQDETQGCCWLCCETGCPLNDVPTGWSGSTETQANCAPDYWQTGLCDTVAACKTGCCACQNSTGGTVVLDTFMTQNQCNYECSIRQGYSFVGWIADATLQECASQFTSGEVTPLPTGVTGTIYGTIKESSGQPIAGAKVVAYGDPFTYTKTTDSNGKYNFTNLRAGSYLIKASEKWHYENQATVSINPPTTPSAMKDIVLQAKPSGVISGTVIDSNYNQPVENAIVYINNNAEALTDLYGRFSVRMVPGTYQVFVTAAEYQKSLIQTVVIADGGTRNVEFSIFRIAPGCTPDAPAVSNFAASPIKGSKSVKLDWVKPAGCNNIVGYYLIRNDKIISYQYVSNSPQVHPQSFIDTATNWSVFYTYKIKVVYDDGDGVERNSSEVSATITTGDYQCEGKYIVNKFTEFCQGPLRVTCDNNNKAIAAPGNLNNPSDCRLKSATHMCAGPNAYGTTICKDAGNCNSVTQGANPFGLYFDETDCYGPSNQNFCYFDYSFTIVDACYQCSSNMSCSAYESENACIVNNCNIFSNSGNGCSWIDLSIELGKGICYQQGYNGTGQCSLCSSSSPLFKNTGCTQEVCSKLGSCFSDITNSGCTACSRCEDLGTESQCTGGQRFTINSCSGIATPSKDICGLGKCAWDSVNKKCFKDGNGNNDADCDNSGVDDIGTLNKDKCKNDLAAPETRAAMQRIEATADLGIEFFSGKDAKTIHYCIDKDNTCCPVHTKDFTLSADGTYSKLTLTALELAEAYPEINQRSDYYFIRYYSDDVFFNQELVKNTSFYADLLSPVVDIEYEIFERKPSSDLIFTVHVSEEASCTDELIDLTSCDVNEQNCDTVYHKTLNKGFLWILNYTVPDGIYKYKVHCVDNVGNVGDGLIDTFELDAFKYIYIYSPNGTIKETNVLFNITTIDPAYCELFDGDVRAATFSSSSGRLFHSLYKTIAPNNHYTNFKAVCSDVTTDANGNLKSDNKSFVFTIDQLPPVTNVTLSENSVSNTISEGDWEIWLGKTATISFECYDSLIGGFGCKNTKYCKTSVDGDCSPNLIAANTILQSSSAKICYQSEDKGGNIEEKKCGIVRVGEPPGIKLVQPPYGSWYIPIFDVIIETKTATSLCKYQFVESPFDFDTISNQRQWFTPVSGTSNRHKITVDFTTNSGLESYPLYVKCKDARTGVVNLQPVFFSIEYDPTIPKIDEARAEPSMVIEGDSTTLYVKTDDMTMCKFSKSANLYSDMNFKFPGWQDWGDESAVFDNEHYAPVLVNENGQYSYNIVCQNKAGNLSLPAQVVFAVNFDAVGSIQSLLPSGSTRERTVNLTVITNKNADCQYQENGDWSLFTKFGTNLHKILKSNLSEGPHTYPVKCLFSFEDQPIWRPGQIEFKVDLSAPNMTRVEDGNYSCGGNVYAQFESQDLSSIDYYNYSIYEMGTNKIVVDWTSSYSAKANIKLINATIGKRYYIKASATDAAGNTGSAISSDGFEVVSANDSVCKNDRTPPAVRLQKDLTSQGMKVTMICSDATGCKEELYGLSTRNGQCNATSDYTGPVFITETKKFCWDVSDPAGNRNINSEIIEFKDSDGDGVPDQLDKCPDTKPGAQVDDKGCSADQNERDSDKDKVPDSKDLCPDTLLEEIQDVDEDGCAPSQLDADHDGVPDAEDQCENTPLGETVDSDGCSDSQKDSDGDGMDDAWELRSCGSVTGCDPNADNDGDGLTNLEEYNYFKRTGKYLDPNNTDTDGDGYTDKEELDAGTDPTNPLSYPEKGKILPITILILGLISLLFGVIYLVYLHITAAKPVPVLPIRERRAEPITAAPQANVEEMRRRQIEEARRREAIERFRKSVEGKKRQREEVFDVFKGMPKKTEVEKPRALTERAAEKEEIAELKKAVQVPKEKEEFEKLAKLTEGYITKGEEKEQLMKMMKISEEDKGVFSKLADMIEKRVVVPGQRTRELTEAQKAEIRDIFLKLGELKEMHKKAMPKIEEIAVKKKPKEEVFDALEKLAPKKKAAKKPFKKLKKISKKRKK